ncbi:MAG: ABC transporter ATP-binding protein [Chloroflexota bacterium]|nr:ABC transporter ATP-binding protein [Chloroflexota bacterium]
MTNTDVTEPLLEVRDLVKHFPVRGSRLGRRPAVRAVDGVSFHIRRGETFGLVGESGCGKTTTARVILRLIPATGGHVRFAGQDVFELRGRDLAAWRGQAQTIFQDAYGSLNPRVTVGASIAEGLVVHGLGTRREREAQVHAALTAVGLRPEYARRYPHEFSGGQRQRIGIARALVLQPQLIVCDEPVSALDVSVQAQVLNLLRDLQAAHGLTYLFIAHNLAVVRYIADRIGVMYLGKLVETAPGDELYREPRHPYTQALLSAIPQPRPGQAQERIVLGGDVPSPLNPPSGCPFHPRCAHVLPVCKQVMPPTRELSPGHTVACHLYEDETC